MDNGRDYRAQEDVVIYRITDEIESGGFLCAISSIDPLVNFATFNIQINAQSECCSLIRGIAANERS